MGMRAHLFTQVVIENNMDDNILDEIFGNDDSDSKFDILSRLMHKKLII